MKSKNRRREFPKRKISETFLDFAAPLLWVVPAGAAKREYEHVLQIAFVVWNAVVYADAIDDSTYLEELRRLVRQDGASRLITDELINRKRASFGDDRRLVGEYKVTMKDGGLSLWAEARSPYPEMGEEAEHPAGG